MLSACDQNGGIMPVDSKSLLSTFEGPKIPSIYDSQLEAAKNAEKSEKFTQASQIYQQILDKEPENITVVFLLAESLRRGGEYDKAMEIYDSLLIKSPSDVNAKEGKALSLLAKGDFEAPTALFEDVLKEDKTRWKTLNGMGILFVTRGLYTESHQYFEAALKQSPNNVSILNNLGLSQALDKQYEVAIKNISQASAQSNLGSAQRKHVDLNLALVYASAGKLEEARKIAELYLSGALLNNNLGLYAHLAKDDALAKSYLNMALTESKTYYSKAWENLEALTDNSQTGNSGNKNNNDVKEKSQNKVIKNKKNKNANKEESKNQGSKITILSEPEAEKSEVKPVEEVVLKEAQTDPVPTTNIKSSPSESSGTQILGKIKAEKP